MSNSKTFGGLCGLLLLATPALAQDAPAAPPPNMRHHPDFAALDVNHDGRLDKAEFAAPMQKMNDELFARLDADHDGFISEAEFKAARDGRKPDGGGRDHDGRPGMGAPGMGPGMEKGGPDHEMKKLDANGDGKISLDEYIAGAKARFERLDANHDGALTEDELRPHGAPEGPSDAPPPPPDSAPASPPASAGQNPQN